MKDVEDEEEDEEEIASDLNPEEGKLSSRFWGCFEFCESCRRVLGI